jgi:tRNA (mo5U34)-methyltransferase
MNEKEVAREIARYEGWYHRMELAPGLVTPGIHHTDVVLERLDRLGLPRSCRGLRALDIGCRDGFFSFELERRGAEVVAIDYADSEVTGFGIAARCLHSSVTCLTDNVYNLDPERYGQFDVVLFLGVLYHLRNPMLALDHLRSVVAPGGLVFVETQLATDTVARDSHNPLWQFYPANTLSNDWSNKWAPNLPALTAVIEECLFHVEEKSAADGRGYVRARATDEHRLAFYRDLDSSTGWWGRKGA